MLIEYIQLSRSHLQGVYSKLAKTICFQTQHPSTHQPVRVFSFRLFLTVLTTVKKTKNTNSHLMHEKVQCMILIIIQIKDEYFHPNNFGYVCCHNIMFVRSNFP